jgi:hypothetical protein
MAMGCAGHPCCLDGSRLLENIAQAGARSRTWRGPRHRSRDGDQVISGGDTPVPGELVVDRTGWFMLVNFT